VSVPVVVALVGARPVAPAKAGLTLVPGTAAVDFFFFFFFSVYILVSFCHLTLNRGVTDLVPSPNRSETVHERNVLPQIGEEPKTRRVGEICDAEKNNTEDGHEEEQSKETQETPTEVVDTLAQHQRPKRVQDNSKNGEEGETSINLSLELTAFPQPSIVHVVLCLLLWFDLDSPLTLDTLRLLAIGACLGLNLRNSKRKHTQRQQLEGVLERGSVGDFGKKGVLLTGLLVSGGLEGSEGSLDSEHVLSLAVQDNCSGLEILATEECSESEGFWVGRSWGDRLGATLLLLWVRVSVRVVMIMTTALLLCLLRSHAHLFLGLSLDVFNKLRDSHAVLLGVDGKLTLHCLDLLGCWSLSGLRHGNLAGPRLRARLRRGSRHGK
jgi:hypothetical protein